MTAPAQQARTLAHHVGRLRPDWRNAERFFEERDLIERALKRLARELDHG